MEKKKPNLMELLLLVAIAGNILFMLWISANGIKEHFSGTMFEKLSYIFLMGLLIVNTLLLIRARK